MFPTLNPSHDDAVQGRRLHSSDTPTAELQSCLDLFAACDEDYLTRILLAGFGSCGQSLWCAREAEQCRSICVEPNAYSVLRVCLSSRPRHNGAQQAHPSSSLGATTNSRRALRVPVNPRRQDDNASCGASNSCLPLDSAHIDVEHHLPARFVCQGRACLTPSPSPRGMRQNAQITMLHC